MSNQSVETAMPLSRRALERLYGWRNRLLGSLDFQRFAASFPLTRGTARARASEVFDLCAGFVYSQILFATVKLGLLDFLRSGSKSEAEIAEKLALSLERTRTLLDAAASLKLVDRLGEGRVGLGPHGAVIVSNPGILKMIEHHAMLYADLADPVGLLRRERGRGALHGYWAYAAEDARSDVSAEDTDEYTALMSASQTLIADDILAAYPMQRHHRLLDIGGGDGTFLTAVAARHPRLELSLFDLPPVAERARVRFAAEGYGHRTSVHGGDFFRDPLPEGADLVTLVRIVHDHDDEPILALMRRIHAVLPPGGRLLVAEPLADAARAERVGAAYFGFYLMAMGSGRPRRADEITGMLRASGFSAARAVNTRMPLQTGLIVADR